GGVAPPGRPDDPGAADVGADRGALPVRPGALGGLRLGEALGRLRPEDVPMALAGAHRALAVGGTLELAVATDGGDGRDAGGDPARPVEGTRWRPGALADLLVGAGFTVEALDRVPAGRPAPAGGDGGRPSPASPAPPQIRS